MAFVMTVLMFVNVILLFCLLIYLGIPSGANTPVPSTDEMKKHIVWYSLYINPNDPRGWVPKIWGYGWTVNFRNRFFATLFVVLVLAQIGIAIALAMSIQISN